MTVSRESFIAAARRYIGTPFHHAGRRGGPDGGLDCAGLAVVSAKDVGYPFRDVLAYSREPTQFRLVEEFAKYLDPVKISALEPGDIGVCWSDGAARLPQHVIIFTDRDSKVGMIHSWDRGGRPGVRRRASERGGVVEHAFTPHWKRRLTHVFALRGVAPWQR